MKILIIGGTRFVGHHIAQYAIDQGHQVTLFNRGKTEITLTGDFNTIVGDRNVDLEKLRGLLFDAVIDTCAYFPKQVEATANVLKETVGKYLLISTISVYEPNQYNYTETSDLKQIDMTSEKITGETYGPLKVGCEKVLKDIYGDNSVIIRPGYIVGDRDYTDRFTYWPLLMKHMEKMIVPKSDELTYQFIDVKDLARFTVLSLEKDLSGAYHIIGPEMRMLYCDFIHLCQEIINPNCELIEMEKSWFDKNEVILPQAYPTYNDNEEGKILFTADNTKAVEAGLTFRPFEETLIDAVEWYENNRESIEDIHAGMKPSIMMEYINRL